MIIVVSLLYLAIIPRVCLAQSKPSSRLPEYYGVYAVDGANLYSLIGGNPSDKAPIQPIEVYSFETGSAKSYSAAALPSGVVFIVFDQASGDLVRTLGLYRLPYGRNLVATNSDAPLAGQSLGPQLAPLHRTLAARLQAFQVPLLSKPIPSQPQMVQVVPSSPLAAGVYLLFEPIGQKSESQWIAVGSPQRQATDCVDITFPAGGFGGVLQMNDYWMMHGPAAFPEITPDHYKACGAEPGDNGGVRPVSASPAPGAPSGFVPPPPQPDCGNYSDCLTKGDDAYRSSAWPLAVMDFEAASGMDAAKPDAWVKLGLANLASGRGAELATAWDKALARGGTVAFDVWQIAGMHYDRSLFRISSETISLMGPNGETAFSVSPSQVTSLQSRRLAFGGDSWAFQLKAAGHSFTFYFFSVGVECKKPYACNSPAGYSQQRTVADYVVQAIQKLSAGGT